MVIMPVTSVVGRLKQKGHSIHQVGANLFSKNIEI